MFVSFNPQRAIPDELTFDVAEFDHPVFDSAAIAAQAEVAALQGARGTWFAGAHLGHGFHEDGLASAVRVAQGLGASVPWSLPAQAAVQQKPIRAALPGFTDPLPAELF